MYNRAIMKKAIHPKYNASAQASCVCGASYMVGSTNDKIEVEICAACHPFYSGLDKVMDTAGRLERFNARRAKAVAAK